jgi:hypothetical protein
MLATYFRPRGIPLRGCHPRDLLNQVASMLRYRGGPRELTLPLLYAACESYFVDNYDQSASYA